MKVTRGRSEPEFIPVVITLETREEARMFYEIVRYNTSISLEVTKVAKSYGHTVSACNDLDIFLHKLNMALPVEGK